MFWKKQLVKKKGINTVFNSISSVLPQCPGASKSSPASILSHEVAFLVG